MESTLYMIPKIFETWNIYTTKQRQYNLQMMILYLCLVNLIQDPKGIKDEFDGLNKRIKKLNRDLDDEDDDQNQNFGNSFVDEVSKDSDDAYSTINELNPYDYTADKAKVPKVIQEADNKKYIEDLTKKLNKSLGLDDEITSLTDEKAWEKFYKHIELNFGNYFVDGKFMIDIQVRYFMCCYVFIFIPAEFAFFYPAMWPRLLPDSFLTNQYVKEVLKYIYIWQKFVKKKSKKKFLITFYVGRKNSLIDDVKFLLRIPFVLFSDPLEILRGLLAFEIKSEGYEEFKNTQLSKYNKK